MFVAFLLHTQKHAVAWITGVTVLFCTLVATVLTFLNGAVWLNFVASYSIGITCMSVQLWVHQHRPDSWNRELVTVVAGVGSLTLGLLLGGTLGAFDPFFFFQTNAIGLVVGTVACIVAGFLILLMGTFRDLEAERDAAQQRELTKERELATTQLRVLQAQIEPHFLFNSLANVQALIDSDKAKARELLDSLTQLFRASLKYARLSSGSVHEEIELISIYLTIQKTRLGKRLNFNIEIEENLDAIEVPPFLLQPLVENALNHGIEPSAKPGYVKITVASSDQTVNLTVLNTMEPVHQHEADAIGGTGLANVESRLRSIYGDAANLKIERPDENQFKVVIELPLELSHS